MCKVAAVTNITDKNRNSVWAFMQLLGELISIGNNDGLGYAALDQSGNIFGEKWLVNGTAFRDLSTVKNVNSENISRIYDCFGTVKRDEAKGIILHTRAATCGKGITNTHPFIDDKDKPSVATIHNGIIYNERQFTRKYSTCDSEVLAHLYNENKVSEDISNLNKFTPKLDGWYTVLNLSKRPTDNKLILDAYTQSGSLSSFFIKELGTRVWSTRSQDVRAIAEALGMHVSEEKPLKADTAIRIDVNTGETIVFSKIKTGYQIPVRVLPSLNGKIHVMTGNLDDQAFRDKWFGDRLQDTESWSPWEY